MKLGLMKRMIATGLCAAMLFTDILPAKAMESVSSGNALEESVSGNDAVVTLEPVTVDGVTITVSGPASAFAEGTTVSAVAVSPAEVVIAAAEENEQATVKKYKAFDINLICEGQVVQPLNGQEIKVNFEGDMLIPDVDNNEAVAVYHVDEDDNVTKMDAEVAPMETEEATAAETVEMTTTHFSTYLVVVTDVTSERKLIIEHWLMKDGKEIQFYAPYEETFTQDPETGKSSELEATDFRQGGLDYSLVKIDVYNTQDTANAEPTATYTNDENNAEQIRIALENPVNVLKYYYTEKEQSFTNEAIFYDYYVDSSVTVDKFITKTVVVENADDDQKDRIVSFKTPNGTTYTVGNDTAYYRVRKNDGIYSQDSKGDNLNRVYALNNKSKVYNVVLQDGTTVPEMTFSVTVSGSGKRSDGKLTGTIQVNDGTETKKYNYNAGINTLGVDIEANGDAFLAMGCSTSNSTEMKSVDTQGQNVHGYKDLFVDKTVNGEDVKELSINTNNSDGNGVGSGERAIVPGIVTGLSNPVNGYYTTVDYGMTRDGKQIVDGGYFTNTQDGDYKYVYDDYSLYFDKNGNTYELNYAFTTDENGNAINKTYSKGDDGTYSKRFLPLSNVPKEGGRTAYQPFYGDDLNYYFGMRYDFTFSAGDYIGDMYYQFIGDDDLWVFVDGKLVLDLGGMHSRYPGDYTKHPESNVVDIWDAVYGISAEERETAGWWKQLTDAEKSESHMVTVLYMERGGWDSSCGMKFVVPNAKAVVPNIATVPRTDVALTKVKTGTTDTIDGVQFTMYGDAGCTNTIETKSTANGGKVSFFGLRAGTYYIKETGYDSNEYLPNNAIYKVVVVSSGTGETANATATVYEVLNGTEKVLTNNIVYNTPVPKADIAFRKVQADDTDNALKGAEFKLTGTGYSKTATSDANGEFTFTGLKAGTYTLEETKTPEGFTNPGAETMTIVVNEDISYEVSADGNIWLTFEEADDVILLKNFKSVDVTVNKIWKNFKDAVLQETPVEQIKVTLYRKQSNGTKDAGFAKEITLKADSNWTAKVSGLEYKSADGAWIYYVEEDTELAGYKVEYSSNYQDEYAVQLTVTNVEQPGALKIIKTVDKVDAVHGDATFTFKVTCPDGSVLYRTMTFSKAAMQEVVIDNLPVGTYVVEELDTLRYELVDGYAKSQSKDVEAEKTTEYEYSNTKVFEKFYSHTDVAVNVVSFDRDDNGNIISSTISRETSSTGVYEVTAEGNGIEEE